jgi:DNA-binding GntR family transcriptional regulator
MIEHRDGNAPPRLSDVVANSLREDILTGKLPPGERLDIPRLSRRFGMSRTPVDDGLRRLEDEGLIVVAPRRGTFISSIDPRDLEEIFEIRAALESVAARRAAQRRDLERIAELNRILSQLQRAIAKRDVDDHRLLNGAFHEHLVTLSGNTRLQRLYDALHAQITIARIHARSASWTSRADLELHEHQRIVDAIASGDADEAAAAVTDHILRAAESLRADLDQTVPADANR